MSDIDLQFEEFMKESLSTDESPETNSSPKQTDVTTKLPEPRTFWWMKPNVPAEPVSHRSSLSSTSIDEKLDSPQLEGNYVPISASPKSASMKSQKNASPDISSSMAEFLEKEKICKELSSSISEVDSPGMDLDDVTDDDIGSIMEQLSQLAGSGDDSAADKSVEEILKEAEDLVRETSHSFSALTDGRELLRVPMTPELVVKGQAADLLPAPLIKSKSKKSGEFYRDKRSSRSSSAPPTARKIGEIAKGKGGRISGTKSSYTLRPTDLVTDIYENSNIDNSFRQSSLSTADGINTNTHAFSHGSSKIKDIPRKEKTVTFNENFIPLETAGTSVLNTHISSQIVQDAHKILPDELETYSDEGNRTSLVANSTSHNEVPSRRRQMTEIVSVSPPLIQHGDVVGTPEAIFQLIDDEVRNEIAAALKESSISINDKEKNSNSSEPENGTVSIEEDMAKNIDDNRNNVPALETVNSAGTSHRRQPLPVVLEESSISEASSEPKTKKSNIMTENSHSKDISVQVTDSTLIEQIESLKEELQQERNKIVHYKDQLSNEEQERKKQLDSLKCKHEEEMFEVKKEVYMLNAKIGDLEKQQMSSADKGSGVDDAATERRIALLEGELQQHEQLMLGYQRENVKLCQDMKQLRMLLLALLVSGVEVWMGVATNSSTMDVLVKPESADIVKEFLDKNGLQFDVVIDDLQAAIDAENPSLTPEEMEELEGRKGHRMTWQSYHRLADIYGYLDYLAQTYPQLVSVQTIGSSVEGRPLKVMKISGQPGSPALWVDGGIHAREWISPASVTYIINELVENRDAHGEGVKNVDWYILPVVNPDGYEYSHRADRLWRKNRKGGVGRCAGTDLNRNFGYKWGGAGSSKEPCKEIYAGTAPFSEPETSAVSNFIQGKAGAFKEEIKTKEQKFADEKQQLISSRQDHEVERLTERLKDKDEVIVRLQIEIQGLKDKVAEFECVTDELETSNKVLKAELEKYKQAASKTTVTPVKTTARNQDVDRYREELAKREREVDEIRKELHLAQSNLVTSKAALSEQQLQVGELETKVSELQIALTKEHAQNREHVLRNEEDKKIIRDLNRQVKEMERILRRHHPNSISALILTANSESADSGSGQTPRVKFLENRVQQLEQELEKSETESKTKMQEIQNKLHEMKVKYEEHTSDLELQLATAKHQSHMWRQAAEKNETKASPESKPEHQPVRETKQMKKLLPPPMVIAVGAPPANALAVREDAHLVATIRGLKQELVLKERELSKIRRELDEIAKTNRRLQRERERQLGIVAAPPRPPAVRGPPRDEHSSESSQRSSTKVYEVVSPPEYQENISKLEQENGKLRQELLCLEEEYRSLQTKRLEDLNLLQEEHEAEIDHLISDHMIRNSNPHISDLQNQLRTQQSLLDHLKEQLRQSDVYREELELLRVERVHLEQSNMELHKKLADLRNLMTPEMIQYEAMQEKLSELERRHEVREQKLQAMVKDLLRRNAEQRALSGDDSNATTMREKLLDKNRQLCLYRAEIDRILDTLREFNRHKKPGAYL